MFTQAAAKYTASLVTVTDHKLGRLYGVLVITTKVTENAGTFSNV